LIPRVVGDLNSVFSVKLVGASGFVIMIAPFPFRE
jgi:hypothetical protein